MARQDDDDDLLHIQDTVVEKSDRLAREYQKEREIRSRQDRVRRIDDDPRRTAPKRSRSSQKPRASGSSPPARPAREPPSAKARDERAEARPRHELPTTPPVAPEVTEPARSTLDLLAMELEEQLREARFGWRALRGADRLTVICSVFMGLGVFLPWRTDPAHPMLTGLVGGGAVHLALAAISFVLVVRSVQRTTLRTSLEDLPAYRRASLWLVLCGAASTMIGAYFLLLIGLEKAPDWSINIRFGLYWTLVSGTGVSYGGFARFAAARRSARAR